MQSSKESDFLIWAEKKGLGLDPQWPDAAVLSYFGTQESRFWCIPQEPERRPYFIGAILNLLRPWKTCWAWRAYGSWPDPNHVDPLHMNDVTELQILTGLGIPLGTANILQFDACETSSLLTLIFATTVFGWSVAEDLYIIPDHAEQFLKVSHHDVIHGTFRNAGDVDHWIAAMSDVGFSLPDDPPDPTFIRPAWMK